MKSLRSYALSLCWLLLAGCGGGLTPVATSQAAPGAAGGDDTTWPRPSDPMGLARQAGLTPDTKEYLAYHVHARLAVFVDGRPVEVPGGIGIDTTNPDVKQFGENGFGGIPEAGCDSVCISPLHTHDVDGVIHVEAPAEAQFTLGQLFAQWAVRLDASCVHDHCTPDTSVAVYVNGDQQSGNPAEIVLRDLQQIAIVIGTPPARIPDSFSGAP